LLRAHAPGVCARGRLAVRTPRAGRARAGGGSPVTPPVGRSHAPSREAPAQ
jgi:hypothetical protein